MPQTPIKLFNTRISLTLAVYGIKASAVLKKGLKILQAQVKEKLQAQLVERKSISSHDEKWLDNEGFWEVVGDISKICT